MGLSKWRMPSRTRYASPIRSHIQRRPTKSQIAHARIAVAGSRFNPAPAIWKALRMRGVEVSGILVDRVYDRANGDLL